MLGDDGVGIRIIQKLEGMDIPDHVDIIDGGAYGWILFSLIGKYEKIIVIDAVRSNQDMESIIFMKASHLVKEKEKYYFSGHDVNLLDILSMMKSVYQEEILDNICILGVRIHKMEESLELSDDITKNMESAIDMIINILNNGGKLWKSH